MQNIRTGGRLIKTATAGVLALLLAACSTSATTPATMAGPASAGDAATIHRESIVMDTHADVVLPETNAIYLASDGLSKVDPG